MKFVFSISGICERISVLMISVCKGVKPKHHLDYLLQSVVPEYLNRLGRNGSFQFLLNKTNYMAIKLTVHYQYIITFIFTSLDIRILRYRIRRIKIDNSFILIRLFRFNKNPVLIQSVIFRVYIFNEKEFFADS